GRRHEGRAGAAGQAARVVLLRQRWPRHLLHRQAGVQGRTGSTRLGQRLRFLRQAPRRHAGQRLSDAMGGASVIGRPLAGVRVVDFTWVRAGPWGTRLLAALGAEVIKVEWPQPGLPHYRQRMGESWLPHGVAPGLNRNPYWSETNAGKRSVTLNMRTPA